MKDFFHQKKNLSLLKKYETENSNPLYKLAYCILKTVYRRAYNFCCVNKIFFMFTITLLSSKVGLPGKGTKKKEYVWPGLSLLCWRIFIKKRHSELIKDHFFKFNTSPSDLLNDVLISLVMFLDRIWFMNMIFICSQLRFFFKLGTYLLGIKKKKNPVSCLVRSKEFKPMCVPSLNTYVPL